MVTRDPSAASSSNRSRSCDTWHGCHVGGESVTGAIEGAGPSVFPLHDRPSVWHWRHAMNRPGVDGDPSEEPCFGHSAPAEPGPGQACRTRPDSRSRQHCGGARAHSTSSAWKHSRAMICRTEASSAAVFQLVSFGRLVELTYGETTRRRRLVTRSRSHACNSSRAGWPGHRLRDRAGIIGYDREVSLAHWNAAFVSRTRAPRQSPRGKDAVPEPGFGADSLEFF